MTAHDAELEQNKELLHRINESFITMLQTVTNFSQDDTCLFECLKIIGLFDVRLKFRIEQFLKDLKLSSSICNMKLAEESLLWLQNSDLSLKVFKAQHHILNNIESVDWSLSFLDEYINISLTKYKHEVYVPHAVTIAIEEEAERSSLRNRDAFSIKQDSCSLASHFTLHLNEQQQENQIKNSSGSCYSTPRGTAALLTSSSNTIITREVKNSSTNKPSDDDMLTARSAYTFEPIPESGSGAESSGAGGGGHRSSSPYSLTRLSLTGSSDELEQVAHITNKQPQTTMLSK